MKSYEDHVGKDSEYYIYSPSRTAKETFLYPLQCGHFIYESGYYLNRDAFDSFLLMYVESGKMTLEYEGNVTNVQAGQFILINCYLPHIYYTEKGCQCLWCHFDGITAQPYYRLIQSQLGNVFSKINVYSALEKMTAIYTIFKTASPVREALISKYLTDILTLFLLNIRLEVNDYNNASMAESTITYINEHFAENITIDALAKKAGLSQYHFIRLFKEKTGFTPHRYLLNSRINAAKYLLKNSRLSTKSICFHTGFSSESVFCSAFKKECGMTPTEYRKTER
jgi:AraC-like DNA-binding protein